MKLLKVNGQQMKEVLSNYKEGNALFFVMENVLMNEFDLFEIQDRFLKTNILKCFKLKQSYEDGGNKIKKYFNEEFKDYFVITIRDGFHPEKIELF